MSYVYLEKTPVAPNGVSKLRSVSTTVTLKITLAPGKGEGVINVTDNFPQMLTINDLLGAIVAVENTATEEVNYSIANSVGKHADGNIYFDLGPAHLYYDVTEARAKFA